VISGTFGSGIVGPGGSGMVGPGGIGFEDMVSAPEQMVRERGLPALSHHSTKLGSSSHPRVLARS
jgi:hypothetical protein